MNTTYYAAFHIDFHCLQKYAFRGFPEYKKVIQNMNTDIKRRLMGNFNNKGRHLEKI